MMIKNKKRIALVLSGGGVKAAAFHIGVCVALQEKGFRFAGGLKDEVQHNYPPDSPMTIRLYVGSSAGSFISTILASGYSVNSLIRAFQVGLRPGGRRQDLGTQTLPPIRYSDLFSWNGRNIFGALPKGLFMRNLYAGGLETLLKERFKINGLFTTDNLEKYLRKNVLAKNDFKDLGVGLYNVATQLNHSRKVIFGDFKEESKSARTLYANHATISQSVAASTSLPPVFAPYSIARPSDGRRLYYYDGEIRETLSTHVAADQGADLVIASYSVQPYHYTPEFGSLSDYGIPVILNQALYQVIQQKIDRHITAQSDIRAIYNAIDGYFKQTGLPDEHREKILEIIRKRVKYKPEVDYMYIHPRAQDHEMFFADHFSLNPKILEQVLKIGFKSAIYQLRRYDL